MIEKLDCTDLECPTPVILTKEAYEELPDDSMLDIKLNSFSSVENVKRFAKKQGIHYKVSHKKNKITVITLIKGYECRLEPQKEEKKPLIALLIGGIISALLASTCCLAPFLFLVFGVSMSSLSFLQIFAPYHNYFTLFALLLTLYLWFDYLKNRKKKLLCETWLSKNYKNLLVGGTFLVAILTTYPYWANYILEKI